MFCVAQGHNKKAPEARHGASEGVLVLALLGAVGGATSHFTRLKFVGGGDA